MTPGRQRDCTTSPSRDNAMATDPMPLPLDALHQQEVEAGQRFQFGKNWQRFLTVLNEDRINIATQSLRDFLGTETLAGRTFLDVGSGSGLFSLAARRLGAARVHSFDFDP